MPAVLIWAKDPATGEWKPVSTIAIEKANEHNVAKGADVAILSEAVSPTNPPCLFRIMVAIGAATIFKADITKGENTQTVEFNSGTALAINALYMFDMLVHSGDTVNWKCTDAATYLVFRVQEIPVATQ